MNIKEVHTKSDFSDFYKIPEEIYKNNRFYRASEHDITKLLVEGPTAFHQHAIVHSYLILQDGTVSGRFSLIHDQKLPEYWCRLCRQLLQLRLPKKKLNVS